jgi:hypothetical protein
MADAPPAESASLASADPLAEDLVGNFMKALDLAPRFCRGCSTYHLNYTARRAVRSGIPDDGARSLDIEELTEFVRELVGERIGRGREPIEVVLPGSADTGLLATCAHGVAAAGALQRVRFTVLDRCPTPLALCQDYGRERGVTVATKVFDLLADDMPPTADLIVLHSVFRFFPPERHRETLRRFMSWLGPGGKLVFSMGLGAVGGRRRSESRAAFKDFFRVQVQSGRIPFAGDVEAFLASTDARGERVGELPDVESVQNLFRDAGVRVDRLAEVHGEPMVLMGPTKRLRVLAVLSNP